MRHVCTYFDINFLPRGMALLDSLEKNSDDFVLYILALDDDVVRYFENLCNKNIQVITLKQYSVHFSIDINRYEHKKEFYFSITPSICLYILKKYPNIDLLLYLDADVYLFNNLELLYDEISDASIAVCSHRLPWYIRIMSRNYGVYNVGVNAFRNDKEGNRCLEQWHSDCSTWTKDLEGYPLSFFSDQIWLDKWPNMYSNIKILDHKGINVAPWNAIQYKFTKKNNQYYVDDVPLVIYHFSSLKKIGSNKWHGNTSFTIHNISGNLLKLYIEYIKKIDKYSINKNSSQINISFSGSKIKIILYRILKVFHNDVINTKDGK